MLDLGSGSGILAILAARAGADSVVAAEVHPSLCICARRNAARNRFGREVTVVQSDVARLERGREVQPEGANVAVFDMMDAGERHADPSVSWCTCSQGPGALTLKGLMPPLSRAWHPHPSAWCCLSTVRNLLSPRVRL